MSKGKGITNDMGMMSVSESLKLMELSAGLKNIIKAAEGTWDGFGKKDSHVLRKKLFQLFKQEKMTPDAVFMVYFFHAAIKDCDRILTAMESLPEAFTVEAWFPQVKNFLTKKMVKYVKNEKATNFASVHLPNTNPGVDIFCAILQSNTPKNDDQLDKLSEVILSRSTMAQMTINQDLQDRNKAHVKNFWDNIVIFKDAQDRKKNKVEVGFQEQYYDTQARDSYNFIGKDMKEMAQQQVDFEFLRKYVASVKGLTVTGGVISFSSVTSQSAAGSGSDGF